MLMNRENQTNRYRENIGYLTSEIIENKTLNVLNNNNFKQ